MSKKKRNKDRISPLEQNVEWKDWLANFITKCKFEELYLTIFLIDYKIKITFEDIINILDKISSKGLKKNIKKQLECDYCTLNIESIKECLMLSAMFTFFSLTVPFSNPEYINEEEKIKYFALGEMHMILPEDVKNNIVSYVFEDESLIVEINGGRFIGINTDKLQKSPDETANFLTTIIEKFDSIVH